ncbi:hypothetical protein PC122_g4972 [Phytophthora cactorum]|nr:hypothetical protein PC122_g4972 [Phytophthora cactorum]
MNALRAVVSGATVRFVQDGFNLDLTYITPRLIAMSYPASGIEKTYRNDINDVAAFLNSRYPSAYRVYNLSERSYDSSKFEGRVKDYGFPANHPPPLQLLIDIVNDMTEWATKNPRNVVVVHCLDGQGCTGVVCSCYLLLTGHYGSVLRLRSERDFRQLANFSIRDFWNTRGRGVRFPSQALYIYYFIKMLRQLGRTPTQIPTYRPAKKIFLKSIVLHGIPDFDAPPKGGCTPFLQILQAPPQQHQSHLLYNSSWQRTEFETYVADPNGEIVYEVNTEMNDDVLVRCLHAKNMGKQTVTMFHFTFNSDFFDKNSNRFRLPTVELDEVTSDERYPDDFHVICHVEVLDTSGNPFAPISSSSSLTSRTRSSSRPRGDEIEDTRVARLQSAPHRQSFCQPDHEEDGQAQASGWLEKSIPTMQSWLYMQCGLLKNWKKRWVVAREDKMIYYRGSVDATPLGFINLREVTVGKCGAEEVNTQNKCLHFFKVDPHTANQRAYFFGAESEPILEAWSHALGAHYMNEGAVASSIPPSNKEECQISDEESNKSQTSGVRFISMASHDHAVTHLNNLLEMCEQMEETREMCGSVLTRLKALQAIFFEKESSISRQAKQEFAKTRTRFSTFLMKYKQGTTFERLVSARTVISLLRDFHVAIDSIETKVSGIQPTYNQPSWTELWERERQEIEARLLLLWGINPEKILDALPDQKSQESALLLLNCESTASQDTYNTYSVESRALLRSVADTVVRLSGASVPVVPGWFIADHEVQRENYHFARGSFGKIYRGTWRGKKVVIKCVNVVSTRDERDFSREARVWLRAQHSNIVRFYGACHLTQPCFFVCEEVTNGNLVDFLSKTKGSDKALTWRLLHDAALGLQFLHQNNIVHGDLKCNQILVSEGLSAKLTDFGMSFVSLESRPATTSGAVRWKAPELLTNEGCTPTFASDIYSFGMCVVEAVSGSVPWRSDLPNIAVIYHLTHGTFLSRPEAFKCDEQWEFVRSLCAFNPSERLGLAAAIEKLDLFARHEQFNAAGG